MTLPSASSSAGDAAATSLAPGFRFHPTDEELVSYYLKRKVLGRPLKVDAIAEVDLYKVEPWDLPGRSRLRSRHAPWYFFSPLDRKHSNSARTNRATAGGYWKTTGKDREVRHCARVVGMKKTLVFHAGRAPKGERTNWVMHEYRLDGRDAAVALARIPQDSYVVCRIFQKSGPGPQNGAQYGAPFVEDDWEDDEEDVGLLPVERDGVCDDEAPGSMDKGYLQMNDLQDLGEQTENSNFPMPVFDTSNNNNHSEDADRSSGVVLIDPSLDNFLQYIEPEENKCTVCSENMVPNTNAGEFSFNSSPNDEYLELKDFVDAVNLEYPLGDDSTIWPSDGWPWETAPVSMEIVNGADGRTGMQQLCNSEFPPITGEETFEPDELEQLLKSIQGDTQMDSSIINPPLSSTNFVKPEDEGLMFYDAPIDPAISDDSFRQFNQYHNSRASNLSGVDIMRYYDALDDILVSGILGPVQQPDGIDSCAFNGSVLAHEVDNTTYTYNPAQKVLEPNFVVGAPSSSSRLPEAGSKLKFQNDCVVVPDAETSTSSIGKHFVKMLDSISAPPAFAAEFPVTHISGTHSNAIRLSAEVISIGSLTVASCPKNWPLKNSEDFELFFSTGFEPDTRVQYGCNSIATVLAGGFCLFFLSAMMLLVSYKVGMCIYGK